MKDTLEKLLKQYWGFDEFRPLQQDIMAAAIDKQDVVALLPTGGGKSICYQLPGLAMQGICIVISPLIALMHDQVKRLTALNIPAIQLSGNLSIAELDRQLDKCRFEKIKFLYLSPERLHNPMVQARLKLMDINLIAVDEAHCISQWGHDFRPSYHRIAELRSVLQIKAPIMALSASATKNVINDIQSILELKEPKLFKKSYLRNNLALFFVKTDKKHAYLLKVVNKNKGSGIIYVSNRKDTKLVAEFLNQHSLSADYYHAGLSAQERQEKQELWLLGRMRIMVCTNAFGMGIDKADVRFVVHLGLPGSVEAYYQEAGRAGRDGKKSFAVCLFNEADVRLLQEQLVESFPPKEQVKIIYQQVGDYFNLAIGAGENELFDFDFEDFCKRYKLAPKIVFHSLELLKQANLIYLGEAFYQNARIQFTGNKTALYDQQVKNQAIDELVKLVLRSYSGAFDEPIKINESILAQKLKTTAVLVKRNLKYLHQLQIINYQEANDKAKLGFVNERLHPNNFSINRLVYEDRKKYKQGLVDAIIELAQNTQTCRFVAICNYFSEQVEEPCGQCDICLKNASQSLSDKQLAEALLTEIKIKAQTYNELKNKKPFVFQVQETRKMIDFLLAEEKIQLTDTDLLAIYRL